MSPDVIRCPRCDEPMEPFHRRSSEGGSVLADMCHGCGGVWLDGREVAEVVPAFEGLAARIADAAPPEVPPGASVPLCPRCRGAIRPFRFFELTLDVCLDCHGLWIDGGELLDLARTADRVDGLPSPLPREHGYRSNALRAARSGEVLCKTCHATCPLEAAEATSVGPMCATCAKAFRDKKLNTSLEGYEPPKDPLFDLSFLGEFARALPVFFGAAMAIGGTCPTCGCHAAARCPH